MRNRLLARIVEVAALALALLLASPVAVAAEAERGRALYESRCASCHAESVHGRRNRAATDFDAVRRWVSRWSDNLGLHWDAQDVEDVAAYLNGRYYQFPCPPDVCKVISLRSAAKR